jgi:hypothetical protein
VNADELGEQVRLGFAALRGGAPDTAIEHLLPAAEHPVFSTQEDMRDLFARVTSVLAQCYLDSGQPGEAQRWLHRAMRALRELTDADGLKQVQPLNSRILTALIQRRKDRKIKEDLYALAASPVEALLEKATTDLERADILIKKAAGELEAERLEPALRFSEEALAIAMRCGATREIVLAHLSIARANPKRASEAIHEAWTCAEQAEEFNLVTLIANAATQTGVPMPTLHGPNGEVS